MVVSVIAILDGRHGERRRSTMLGRPVGVHHRMRDRDTRAGKAQQACGERSEESGEAGPGHEPILTPRQTLARAKHRGNSVLT